MSRLATNTASKILAFFSLSIFTKKAEASCGEAERGSRDSPQF
jgi:hypothetical protein